jgi:hypothetical protein
MVGFNAKFQKKLNGKTRFRREDPNFVNFSIVDQSFLPQDIIEKLHKIGSFRSVLAIQFILI